MGRNVVTIEELDELTSAMALESALLILLGAALGALFAVVIAPQWLPGLASSLVGPSPKGYWYLARVSGLIAYAFLWASVALGLVLSSRLARLWPGGPTVADLHQFTSLLALTFAIFHVLILLGDRYIGYTLGQLLVPFAGGDYRPQWVGLGQLSFYIALPIAFSFYVRRRIGHRTWRLLHYTSFGVYLLVTAHGMLAGTDSSTPAVLVMYAATGIAIYFLTVYRLLASAGQPRRAAFKQVVMNPRSASDVANAPHKG